MVDARDLGLLYSRLDVVFDPVYAPEFEQVGR
jgi:hypothetical protein